MKKDQFDHIDLFSGIGGFSLGLQLAGVPISKTYFSEKDKHAISVYKRNFPDAEYLGPVESIPGGRFKGRKLIITFGFPCQDLSIAGKGKGFDGSRSSLFFEAMRIVEESGAELFVFENVKNFFSNNDGKDFKIALQTIADIGIYECQWQLLDTAWFLPQNRERVYLVGSSGNRNRPKIFPIREENSNTNKARTMIRVGTLRTHKDGEGFRKMESGLCPTLNSRARQDDSQQPIIISNSAVNRKWENREDLPPLRSHSGCSHDNYVSIEDVYRRLTPIEWERLQGFPDNWTQYGHEGQLISDTQRYKMCGNAVTVPIVQAIGTRIKKST